MKIAMKISTSIVFLAVLATAFFSCGSDDSDDPSPGGTTDLGTYAGNIQVADDPQTELGYLYNAKVTVTGNGANATVKIVADPGFNREYTGTLTSQAGMHDVTLTKQTKPVEKIAGERVLIMNNKLTVSIDVANDEVTVKEGPAATATIQITGKLQMIGTDMLKE